ncbi:MULTISPECIES: succinate dehydrogenase, cytochrome b556 subunit [unclassified Colwellia]|uniref:succinate dehydrogenase, cytochrome b556 subunit n=1 Tax=unclassified Colwellia TaxID=196834 RepID=UPI0015F48CC2|nr:MULTISPECIES: succinate dehydrogenase, cytochrome b556 subunit [unclassified Colwellia]MBA6225063.1 succinate dehydrogenase, cytochrome b556 subunit [Colwellia sp. MB3u-45]MBA6268649.1 succinate dehydrogenase, cytochrome b556 subunit [Colwellia sp. MB3u-43]MBA6290158.1 succinate dehydrogenase, cytochrome b556 subunit [Colwellia sp. MB3u-4]MBA6296426.1 succinate dehydrogenase, cytochrome b556 subunit [Colwellia sp. MB02u-9]MBA6321080.1 succinate dehydrogenase, cytochrome b556 subunit [Colwel
MKKQRPVNLDLSTIKMHAAANASILHRVSGVIMVFAIGILLWTLSLSLSSAEGFSQIEALLSGVFFKIIILGTLSALIYHLLGGIRHLIMDLGYFEELASGNATAKFVIALWLVLTVVVGVKLW